MKIFKPQTILYSFFTLLLTLATVYAQAPKRYSASDIQLALKKLNVLGSALYMAAHPDDENQRLITYMANERLMRSAYLSLTRGDGGQNLVGPEIREQLGVIRTQELLEARRLDGGQQFFTRANDFGYSKTADETLKIWDKEQVFSDVVWVVRNFRPDIIITRFPPNKLAGHGHHTSSAMLAIEAYQKAGDPNVFPEQLRYVEPWQPKRVMWNSHPFFFRPGRTEEKFDSAAYLIMDLNQYNQLLGKSYSEIAALSRSNHKTQGFGATGRRGEVPEFFGFLIGSQVKEDLLEGIDFSWGRIKGGENIQTLVKDAYDQFDPENPSGTVPALLDIRQMVDKLEDKFWRKEKLKELDELLIACTGLYMEAVASEFSATPGAALDLSIEVVNRSPIDIKLIDVSYLAVNKDTLMNHQLLENKKLAYKTPIELPGTLEISQPYWLKEP
ncbi:MAG: PIG-L family deacetylase, partial [Bacteroidetes bacterium]|nr:PIG-L family deacetylase [Bacteroidota bacterium]